MDFYIVTDIMQTNSSNTLAHALQESYDDLDEDQQRRSLFGRVTDRFKAALGTSTGRQRGISDTGPMSTATTVPDGNRQSIPAPPPNDPFYKKIMGGALAIVLERPEIIAKIWGVRGKEEQYSFFRAIYDPTTRQSVMKRLLNGFKNLFCGESTLDRQEWIKILNVANQLSNDGVIPATLMNKMVKLYQYQVQGKKTQDNIVAIHDVCLDESVTASDVARLHTILW